MSISRDLGGRVGEKGRVGRRRQGRGLLERAGALPPLTGVSTAGAESPGCEGAEGPAVPRGHCRALRRIDARGCAAIEESRQ